jgi:5'-nucleotidase
MPLRIRRVDEDFWTVIGGTPADCVHLGYYVLLDGKKPDMVCSGINEGPNLGEDITYSGTVSGAMEGRILGIPSVAFSAFGGESKNFSEIAKVAKRVVIEVLEKGMPEDTYLNVNIPDLPQDQIKGFLITKQGRRAYKEKVLRLLDPRQKAPLLDHCNRVWMALGGGHRLLGCLSRLCIYNTLATGLNQLRGYGDP